MRLLAALVLAVGLCLALAATPSVSEATSSPVIYDFSPTEASVGGGSSITISGSGFAAGASVYFGLTRAVNGIVLSGSTILVTTPSGQSGPVELKVVNPDGGTAIAATPFYFGTPSPVLAVSGISPSTGSTAGGTIVTITGVNMSASAAVTFGGTPGAILLGLGGTLSVRVPSHAPGTVSITVTNPDGTSATLPGAFAFIGSAPTPISLPSQGFGLFVFAGGSSEDLVRASGCPVATATFWASTGTGGFVTYLPGTSISAVNAAWVAMFATGIPQGTPMLGKCS